MHLFYEPNISGNTVELNEEESHHALKVLRLKTGDVVRLSDGLGCFYTAEITSTSGKKAGLLITHKEEQSQAGTRLHIAMAPTKSIERFEFFLEKATETGIATITPLLCSRSERRQIREDRLEKVIVSAAKQSLKAWMPKFEGFTKFDDFVNSPTLPQHRYIAWCDDAAEKKELKEIVTPGTDILVLIGPEGDFTPAEVELALKAGFVPITLGNTRLRTETAGIVVASVFNFVNG
jgi:16S rRNA (uracil1498-N3)-methyltransferase